MSLDPRHVLARAALDVADPAARPAPPGRRPPPGRRGARGRLRPRLGSAPAPAGADPATIGLGDFGVTVAGGSAVPEGSTIGLSDLGAGPGPAPPRPPAEAPGALVAGRYRLGRAIGEGGMGTVYLAEQVQPVKRQVALKLVRAGMDSRQVLARFESERQALAIMDHPHIARVLDAGSTDSGHPFFVMELVRGVPLTEYCDARRLDLPRRLDLFRQICGAVQHAHQRGVIHRDLKPTNILVEEHDGAPVPKVIDFGLAKATSGPTTPRSSPSGRPWPWPTRSMGGGTGRSRCSSGSWRRGGPSRGRTTPGPSTPWTTWAMPTARPASARALPLLEDALGRRRAKLGPDHPDTLTALMMLAEVYESLGQVANSTDTDRQYLLATRRRYGPDAPKLAAAQANVATKLLRREDWAAAEPILRACLAIREHRAPDDWRTDNTRSLLGGALLGPKRPDEARPVLVAGFAGMDWRRDKIPGRAADRLVAAADRLIRLAEATNRPDEATAWRAAKARIEAPARPPAPTPAGTNPAPPSGARPAPLTAEPTPTPIPAPRP